METTMDLLDRALAKQRQAAWARQLNIDPSALAQAKKRNHLSPTLAGALAMEMGEDERKWLLISALEGEPETPLLQRIKTATAAMVFGVSKS